MKDNHKIYIILLVLIFITSFHGRSQTWKPRTWREIYVCNKETFVRYIQSQNFCFGQQLSWDTVCYECSYNNQRILMPDSIYTEFIVVSKSVLKNNYYVTAAGKLRKTNVYSYLCQSDSQYKNFSILTTKRLFHVGCKYSTMLFPVFDKDCDRITGSDGQIMTLVHGPATYLNFFLQNILLTGVLGNINYFYVNETVRPQKISRCCHDD